LRPKRAEARFQIREKRDRDWRFNRDLYLRVGQQWDWVDKRPWTDAQWKEYAAAEELYTFAAYYDDLLAGYYELRRDTDGGVEIAYFGLLSEFIGRGLGELSGERDDRLQGRGRALAATLSYPGRCQLPLQSAGEGMFRRLAGRDSRQIERIFRFFEISGFKIFRKG
jgi:hypothetical protein